MSRIGRLPIPVPAGVTVTIDEDNNVTVKGPKGELSQKVNKDIKVEQVGAEVIVSRPSDSKPHRSMHGLYRSLINNMVVGVTKGFEKTLAIEGVGWRVAEWNKNQLNIAIGFSHPVIVDAPEGIEFDVDKSNVKITVKGIDKQAVGAIAADIRAIRKPEPYHGKGIRYENEVVRRKEGKAGKK
jgi:large subunit ribosomal protein L6